MGAAVGASGAAGRKGHGGGGAAAFEARPSAEEVMQYAVYLGMDPTEVSDFWFGSVWVGLGLGFVHSTCPLLLS